eukprot:CAMPEP_0185912490 /NCGR_PEP_ID=MMETSP0196C-20130402/39776_1 /TAXON_ID=2932 /ORGANISM="Alexandrium fundyense, Strain CCMP1719" /LENGTH=54 /DNA_ID=CAMNT_0028633753 /DNA_START=23 /DNA_END=184 /DNA_ORIENTATION=-
MAPLRRQDEHPGVIGPRQLSPDDPCEDRPDLLWDAVEEMGVANYNCVFLTTGWI